MAKSHRILTTLGVDKSVEIQLDQDFDFLEILSLKITQSEIYARMCADYGVVVGRVIANSGYGIPNARVSVFVPLSDQDEQNPVISTLYPYKTLTDKNEDGYRYNLLPYIQSYSNHVPTGTFPSREDVLINTAIIEVYDKYYKYTAKTNDSGDFMIFGVPVGSQVIVMDLDLSDMGEFSLSPQDLIRMGIATENQVNGVQFRSSTNLDSLPQLININKEIEVLPFWGQPEVCQFAITREDFDLVKEANLEIQPTAIFMGSIISTIDRDVVKRDCKPKLRSGQLCRLTTGPGEILAIRQTIFNDSSGYPILEQYVLEEGGKVIDDNGTWLIDLPMNMDYVTTDQFGNQVISNDPKVGIPTTSKYRFKVKWQQSPQVNENIKRGYFLIPNIREYGWISKNQDPYIGANLQDTQNSYAFSLDWNDYGNTGTTVGRQMIQDAIDCDDRFYKFKYNKVYTISQLITEYREGKLGGRFVGIKNITDDNCESENNPFPSNDAIFRPDILFLLFMLLMTVLRPVLYVLIIIAHILKYLVFALMVYLVAYLAVQAASFLTQGISQMIGSYVAPIGFSAGLLASGIALTLLGLACLAASIYLATKLDDILKWDFTISLPLLTYPDCELCSCNLNSQAGSAGDDTGAPAFPPSGGFLYPFDFSAMYASHIEDEDSNGNPFIENTWWGFMLAGMRGISTKKYARGHLEKLPGPYDPQTKYYYDRGFIGTSLTIPEIINVFNLKSKYFDTDNGGTVGGGGAQTSLGGWNQIKVAVQPTLNFASLANPFSNIYHYDKPLVLITTESWVLNAGEMISFQDPKMSSDPNVTGGTFNVTFGNNAITGTVINTNAYTITYANPLDENDFTLNNVTYNIATQSGETLDNLNSGIFFHKFQTDVEYFQVITGITYLDYYNMFNPSFPPYSFLGRLEGNRIFYETTVGSGCAWNNYDYRNGRRIDVNPVISGATNVDKARVYILFRGVDPYSTRQETAVDLSRIFGYDYGSGPIVVGNYKLNWPIQTSLKLPDHSVPVDNGSLSNGAGYVDPLNPGRYRFFFPSLSYRPGITGTTELFIPYNTTLHNYYSNLSSTSWTNDWPFYDAYGSLPGSPPIASGFNLSAYPPSLTWGWSNGQNVTVPGSQNEIRTTSANMFTYYMKNDRSFWTTYFGITPASPRYWVNPINPEIYYSTDTSHEAVVTSTNITSGGRGKGYWCDPLNPTGYGEYIEGGTLMAGKWNYLHSVQSASTFFASCNNRTIPEYVKSQYFSRIYPTYNQLNIKVVGSENNIVMRTERLPSSTSVEQSSELFYTGSGVKNDYIFHQNGAFQGFKISDDGVIINLGEGTTGFSFEEDENAAQVNNLDRALSSFSCGSLLPLSCYGYDSTTQTINTSGLPGCTQFNGKDIFIEGSCYRLVTTNIKSLKTDLKLLGEWVSRMIINFGACQDVFSHLFVNNWINGTLYAFAFRNDVFYSGVSTTNPSLNFCKDVVILHQKTNNFYYRSSPYNYTTNQFIGKGTSGAILPTKGGNKTNLLYPTTILDLGPRSDYINQLSYSADYDGYVADRLISTTFGDTSDLLNYLIISRMINLKFIQVMVGSAGANIFSYFTRYGKTLPRILKIDADFAQMISINSELGVASFDPANYPDPPSGNPPVFYAGSNATVNDVIIGVFYSSDTETRDYITPRRQMVNYNNSVPIQSQFQSTVDFYYINTNSQLVPFYKWKLKLGSTPFIFGSQENDWQTNPASKFFSYKYQEIDRLLYPATSVSTPDQYMMTVNSTSTSHYKGYIYSVNASGDYEPSYPSVIPPVSLNEFLVGAPYHFYFGLKQGKSAYNRFVTKWIKPEVIT